LQATDDVVLDVALACTHGPFALKRCSVGYASAHVAATRNVNVPAPAGQVTEAGLLPCWPPAGVTVQELASACAGPLTATTEPTTDMVVTTRHLVIRFI
jgi:hypothetical protein